MDRHDDEKKKVVLTPDDFKNVEEFFNHFKIHMPESLSLRIEAWKKDPKNFSFDDQKLIRAYIANAINTVNHPLVKDDVFKNIRAKCDKAWYDAQFDMDLEEILSAPRDK